MRRIFVLAILLSGCTTSAPTPEPLPIPLPPLPATTPVATPTTATLTPQEIIIAAGQAHHDATGYVAWSRSKPENIDRLTTLTTTLDSAVARLKAGRVHGRYRSTDVLAARSALRELRSFLMNKGD